MSVPTFFPYAHQSIDSSDKEAVLEALSAESITRGKYVEAFEKAVAEYCGAQYAVVFNSATTALIAACYAAKVSANDRIFTTPNSFVASTTAAMHFGAEPTFIDIELESGNIDLELLEPNIKGEQPTRGKSVIIPVHFSGIPVDMQKLERMISSPDTIVIEDAAHAFGSTYKNGKRVGCCEWSQMTVFSFHAVKTITSGEGGMVLTNDEDLYSRLKMYRNNAIEKDQHQWLEPYLPYEGYYQVFDITGNYNFTDFQAALGRSQLKRVESFILKRRKLVEAYRKAFEGLPYVQLFNQKFDPQSAYHLFVVQIDFSAFHTTREYVISALKAKGIGTQVHYIPIYRHPFFFQKKGDISQYFPKMEQYYSQALSLPLYYDLRVEDVEHIVQILKDILIEERQKKKGKKNRKRT